LAFSSRRLNFWRDVVFARSWINSQSSVGNTREGLLEEWNRVEKFRLNIAFFHMVFFGICLRIFESFTCMSPVLVRIQCLLAVRHIFPPKFKSLFLNPYTRVTPLYQDFQRYEVQRIYVVLQERGKGRSGMACQRHKPRRGAPL
jgi:hypothetical protein